MGFRVSRSAAAGKQPEPDSVEVAMQKAIAVGLAVAKRIQEAKDKIPMPIVNPGLETRTYKKRVMGTAKTTVIRTQKVERTVKVAATPKKPRALRVRTVMVASPKRAKTRMVKSQEPKSEEPKSEEKE